MLRYTTHRAQPFSPMCFAIADVCGASLELVACKSRAFNKLRSTRLPHADRRHKFEYQAALHFKGYGYSGCSRFRHHRTVCRETPCCLQLKQVLSGATRSFLAKRSLQHRNAVDCRFMTCRAVRLLPGEIPLANEQVQYDLRTRTHTGVWSQVRGRGRITRRIKTYYKEQPVRAT